MARGHRFFVFLIPCKNILFSRFRAISLQKNFTDRKINITFIFCEIVKEKTIEKFGVFDEPLVGTLCDYAVLIGTLIELFQKIHLSVVA